MTDTELSAIEAEADGSCSNCMTLIAALREARATSALHVEAAARAMAERDRLALECKRLRALVAPSNDPADPAFYRSAPGGVEPAKAPSPEPTAPAEAGERCENPLCVDGRVPGEVRLSDPCQDCNGTGRVTR